jgi:ParB family chromosome partitioning protein
VNNPPKDRRLGRGLAALLGTPLDEEGNPLPEENGRSNGGSPRSTATRERTAPRQSNDGRQANDSSATHEASDLPLSSRQTLDLNVYEIDNNPFQPRRDFNPSEIASLAESLKEHEQLQPILVRKMGDRYQLISGERRLRAAIHAGLSTVRAEVRVADDRLVAELAIIENLQRKDLNAIEKALSFRRYIEQHNCTQDELGSRLKIDRSTIANMMRLLELPEQMTKWIQEGALSAGHGRALLPIGDESLQLKIAKQIIDEGWSVRAAEFYVAELIRDEEARAIGTEGAASRARRQPVTPQIEALQRELKLQLGTKVEIRQTGKGKGKITIHFHNADEFERLRALISTQSTGSTPKLRVA